MTQPTPMTPGIRAFTRGVGWFAILCSVVLASLFWPMPGTPSFWFRIGCMIAIVGLGVTIGLLTIRSANRAATLNSSIEPAVTLPSAYTEDEAARYERMVEHGDGYSSDAQRFQERWPAFYRWLGAEKIASLHRDRQVWLAKVVAADPSAAHRLNYRYPEPEGFWDWVKTLDP